MQHSMRGSFFMDSMSRVFPILAACACAWSANAAEVHVTLDPAHPGREVPRSFAGISHEWGPFAMPEGGSAAQVHPTYLRLLEHLCAFNDTALCFRIGGATADQMRKSPEPDRWRQLGEIFKTTRTPLVININLASGTAELPAQMIRDAQKFLPPAAILSFELGNEPDGWPNRHRPENFDFAQYLDEFDAVAGQLSPALTPSLAGPAWAHGAVPEILSEFIARNKTRINLLTVHAYRFDPKSKPGPVKLLDERAVTGFAEWMGDGIKTAHDAGLKLRLDETGSAWGGGVAGFSDSFGASLWTLDFFLALADAGLDGINLHSVRTNAYSVIREDVDKGTGRTTITVNAPYYGMLVFAEAVARQARFVPVSTSGAGKVKLWATLDRRGALRVVAINKDATDAGDVMLKVGTPFSGAAVKRLEAASIEATRGIRYAGQTFDDSADGNPIGALLEEKLPVADGGVHFRVAPASAVLVTLVP